MLFHGSKTQFVWFPLPSHLPRNYSGGWLGSRVLIFYHNKKRQPIDIICEDFSFVCGGEQARLLVKGTAAHMPFQLLLSD
jgi:hypothetical protein